MVTAAMKSETSWQESYEKPRQCVEKQRHYSANKGLYSQGYSLELDCKKEDHDIQFHYFMANRWGKVETVTDFLFLGSEVTADNDCTHEIKRCLLLGNKAMTILDSV